MQSLFEEGKAVIQFKRKLAKRDARGTIREGIGVVEAMGKGGLAAMRGLEIRGKLQEKERQLDAAFKNLDRLRAEVRGIPTEFKIPLSGDATIPQVLPPKPPKPPAPPDVCPSADDCDAVPELSQAGFSIQPAGLQIQAIELSGGFVGGFSVPSISIGF
ncbi:MAG: hypothetical protein ACE5IL_04410 [Myxococcota bacterium]